jgi:hypothetical protein
MGAQATPTHNRLPVGSAASTRLTIYTRGRGPEQRPVAARNFWIAATRPDGHPRFVAEHQGHPGRTQRLSGEAGLGRDRLRRHGVAAPVE